MATPVLNYTSEQHYLEAERKAFEKHEYYKVEIFAISGALLSRNEIFSNLFVGSGSQLKYKSLTDIFSVSTVATNTSLADIYEGVQID